MQGITVALKTRLESINRWPLLHVCRLATQQPSSCLQKAVLQSSPPTLTGTLVSTSRMRFMESRMLARCMRSAVWICIAAMKFCQSEAPSPHSQGNLGRQ